MENKRLLDSLENYKSLLENYLFDNDEKQINGKKNKLHLFH
jgi:hypothetical protein